MIDFMAYSNPKSSTSNVRVAFGGITPKKNQ